jgi:hypothetical protein
LIERVVDDVGDLNHDFAADDPRIDGAGFGDDLAAFANPGGKRRITAIGDRHQTLSVIGQEITVIRITKLQRLVEHRLEDGREIAGCRIDDLQHLGRRLLLGERFGELSAQLGILLFEGSFPVVALAFHRRDFTTRRAAAR